MIHKLGYATQLVSALLFGAALCCAAILFSLQLLINAIRSRFLAPARRTAEWDGGSTTGTLAVGPSGIAHPGMAQLSLSDPEVDTLLSAQSAPRAPRTRMDAGAEVPCTESTRYQNRATNKS